MKRAFFKIGRQISVMSNTLTEEWKIDIDVPEWQSDNEDWDFKFTYARKKKSLVGGTRVEITDILPVPAAQFGSFAFQHLLRDRIAKSYALFLRQGLELKVKTEAVQPDLPPIAESKGITSVRHFFKSDGVDILIMAGVSAREDRTPRGWYVFCNGRLILDGDKTEKTGWGVDNHATWHTKYNHFLGYVYFKSKDVRKLPWTTTKDSIDRESSVYQAALGEMRLLSRPILEFFTRLYPDVKQDSEPERKLFDEAKPVEAETIAGRKNTGFQAKVVKSPEDQAISIQYKRTRKQIDRVKRALGKPRMSAADVGAQTFDWYYNRNCKNGDSE